MLAISREPEWFFFRFQRLIEIASKARSYSRLQRERYFYYNAASASQREQNLLYGLGIFSHK